MNKHDASTDHGAGTPSRLLSKVGFRLNLAAFASLCTAGSMAGSAAVPRKWT